MRILLIFLSVLIAGCYNQRKAQIAVSKADAAYPSILAKLCAEKFPVIETVIKGDTVTVIDTVEGEGVIITETITVRDTVVVTKTLPPKTITKTIRITDTLVQENKAAIKACELVRDQALQIATDKTAEAASWKKKAKNRFWILTGIAGLSLLLAGLWIRRKAKGK